MLIILALIVVTDNLFDKKEDLSHEFSSHAEGKAKRISSVLISKNNLIDLGLIIAVTASVIINVYCLNNRSSTILKALIPSYRIEEYDKVLPKIPRDEIIWADPFFTTYLADTEFLYDLDHHKYKEGEQLPRYIVMPKIKINTLEDDIQLLIDEKYMLDDISGDYISVYKLME